MSGLQGFLLGLAVGLFVAGYQIQRLNDRWYRTARSNAKAIVNAATKTLREVADWVPDPDVSAQIKQQADKADEVWR